MAPLDARWGKPAPTHNPEILANFVARPTDILITTAPKAGTTWMQQLLHQLRSGGDPDFHSIDAVVPWLELSRPDRSVSDILAEFDRLPDPRIFKTHCTFEQTPGVDTARLIMTSRDPRDCCTSFYHHVMDMTDAARAQAGLRQYPDFDTYLDDWLRFASWYRNVQSWWPERGRDNLLWLRFEDMKRNLPACVDRIVAFLDWDVSAAGRAAALEYASFAWMKAHADKFTRQLASDEPVFKPGGFIRKGAVGDHKTRLTPAQAARILEQARAWLEPACLDFLGL